MNIRLNKLGVLGLTVVGLAAAQSAHSMVAFNFVGVSNPSSNVLISRAEFTVVGGTTLEIVLINNNPNASLNGADVLGGLYFDLAGGVTFSNGQATLGPGSNFIKRDNAAAGATNPLNNEWMYKAGTLRDHNIGATGFFSFNTNDDTFTEVFHGGSASAGANDNYGIVPTAGIWAGNSSNVYVQNSMKFTFTLSAAVLESDISDVVVSYGSNGQTVLTPEPATMGALAVGAIALIRRRRSK